MAQRPVRTMSANTATISEQPIAVDFRERVIADAETSVDGLHSCLLGCGGERRLTPVRCYWAHGR